MKNNVLAFLKRPTIIDCITPIIGTIIILVVGNLVVPGFATKDSIINYVTLATMTIFACIGQFLVITSGKGAVDLSIGSIISLGAAFGGTLAQGTNAGLPMAMAIMVLIAAVCGYISGMSVQFLSIPAMVVTLSVGGLLSSSYIAITKGRAASGIPPIINEIAVGRIGNVRILLIISILLVVLMEIFLRKSQYGKSLFLVGTSERAAVFCGIRSNRVVVLSYVLSAVAAAVAGFILLGITGSMQAGMGEQYTMLSIAACVIGGIALAGGKGTFVGAGFAAVMLTTLNAFLMVVNIPEGARNFTKGIILLAILVVYGRGPKLRQ